MNLAGRWFVIVQGVLAVLTVGNLTAMVLEKRLFFGWTSAALLAMLFWLRLARIIHHSGRGLVDKAVLYPLIALPAIVGAFLVVGIVRAVSVP